MTSRDRFVKSFQNIGKFETLTDESEAIMSEYVGLLFGSKLLCVNDARVELFKRGKFSEELLPPNDDFLKKHLQRANYQAFVWKSCLSQFIPNVKGNPRCQYMLNSKQTLQGLIMYALLHFS